MLCLVGCNSVFGLDSTEIEPDIGSGTDIDLDGIRDDMDPCIASAEDLREDTDSDGMKNDVDRCPLDVGGSSTDGDDIPESCDPFPGIAGDRLRCSMTFNSADLNRRLWVDANDDWSYANGALTTSGGMPTSVVASVEVDRAPETTIDLAGFWSPLPDNSNSFIFNPTLRIWIRTSSGSASSDLGCELSGSQGMSRLAIVDGSGAVHDTISLPTTPPTGFRLKLTYGVDASTPNLRCRLDSPVMEVRAQLPLPAGHVGLSFVGDFDMAAITSLEIYERDTNAL